MLIQKINPFFFPETTAIYSCYVLLSTKSGDSPVYAGRGRTEKVFQFLKYMFMNKYVALVQVFLFTHCDLNTVLSEVVSTELGESCI